MKAACRLAAVADRLASALGVVAIAALVAIFFINTIEIVARTLFDHSFAWIYEVNLLLASWLYFLGIAPVYRRGGDITLRGYERLLHGRARNLYRVGIEVTTAATFGGVAWFAWELVALQLPFRTPGMRIPNALFTAPLLIGAVALSLTALSRALAPPPAAAPVIEAGF